MPTSAPAPFQLGDRVLHPTKPEWGAGLVVSAKPAQQDGRPCQRLDVRFDKVGLKTMSTAFVELRPLAGVAAPEAPPIDDEPAGDPRERLLALPDAATDPFSSAPTRLRATLELYRFEGSGSGLIGWATAQTGMVDPLTELSRHELEEAFGLWRRRVDSHLAKVSAEARRADPKELAAAIGDLPDSARDALRRVNARR